MGGLALAHPGLPRRKEQKPHIQEHARVRVRKSRRQTSSLNSSRSLHTLAFSENLRKGNGNGASASGDGGTGGVARLRSS